MNASNEQPTMRADRTESAGGGATRTRTNQDNDWTTRNASAGETQILGGPSPSFAWLVVFKGAQAGRIFNVSPRGTTVGREMTADVILDDPAIGRQHIKLRTEKVAREGGEDERYFVIDLASQNGTKVNGTTIVKQEIKDGDRIEIGETTLIFKQV